MAAPNQAGVFGGKDPSAYNPQDPVVLFIIQVYNFQRYHQMPHHLIAVIIQGKHYPDL